MTETKTQDRATRIAPYYRSLRLEFIKLLMVLAMWAAILVLHRQQPSLLTGVLLDIASWAVVLYILIEAVSIVMLVSRNAVIRRELGVRPERPSLADRVAERMEREQREREHDPL